MTIFNLDYYNDDGGYSDGSVETDLLHLFKEGKTAEEILKSDSSWPYVYHLSSVRSNILSWFPFKKDCSILEVGSGCGALTEILSRKAKEVTSIELTKPRAEVNYYRNKDLENVEIIVGNFNSINLDKKYDYIILNGVLEYAGSFTQSENPYFSFLQSLKKYLKPDGALIIAIENRLGLKYLNGAPEDHTGILFSGINDYTGVNSVRTFSKNELIELLKRSGFKTIDFFYPYPDYKLPEVIFTDETLDLIDPSQAEVSYNFNRLKFYDEDKMINTLNYEGILDRFTNSFLVVCSEEKQDFKSVLYAKFSPNRDKRFALMTTIENSDSGKIVRKSPVFPEGKAHLESIYQNYLRHKDDKEFTPVKAELKDNSIIFEFIEAETLEKKLSELVLREDWEELKKQLNFLKNYLLKDSELTKDGYTKEFKAIFGDKELDRPLHFKSNSSFDMLLTNIMDDEAHHLIDYEWEFDFQIPQEFIFFRLLYYFYLQEKLADRISFIDLMKMVDDGDEPFISMQDFDTFLEWDNHFGMNYVKGSFIENKPMITEDSEEIFQKAWQRTDITSSLYIDFGDGFTEDNRVKLDLITDDEGRFKITFDLKALDNLKDKEIVSIRWDPLETYLVLEDFKAYSNKGPLQNLTYAPYTSLCIFEDGKYIFVTDDPSILLYGDFKGLDSITIEGKIRKLSMDEVYDELFRIHNARQQLKNDKQLIQDELDRNRLELINYDNALNNLIKRTN